MKTLNQQLTLFPVTEESFLLSKRTRKMKYTIEDLKKYAIKKKGKCLSDSYIRNDHKYLWKCENKLHKEFEAQWSNVNRKKRGQWCRDCYVESLKMDFTIIESKIEEFGGKLITKKNEYINNKSPIIFNCEKGHECKSSWDRLQQASLKDNGKKLNWCSKCSRRKPYTLEEVEIMFKKKGGVLLSTEYVPNKKKYLVRCNNNHEFEINLGNFGQNQWCSYCNKGYGEEYTRFILEHMFNCLFPKKQPDWLKGLHLDGYNEELKIAFEYQGIQHKEYTPVFHDKGISKFEIQKKNDKNKRALCKKEKVILIEIDDTNYNKLNLYDILKKEIKKKKIQIINTKKIDADSFHNKFYIDKTKPLRKIVSEKNGKWNSIYYGQSTPILFECEKGHEFKKTPAKILKGIWCPEPGCNEKARDVNKVKTYIEEKGGVLLSEYRNNHSPIEFRCENGHINTTTWQSLRVSWCCKCAGNCKGTIDEMKEIAKAKGGYCLSTEYLGSDKKLEWTCQKNNHKSWFATPSNIKPTSTKQGSWCPECWKEKKQNRRTEPTTL
jgi:hypothetical protein